MFRILFVSFLLLFSSVQAAPPKLEKQHKNWLHQSCLEGKKRIHYILSQPTKSTGKYKKRGEVYLLVTRENKKDVVSFVTGYTFKKGSSVTLRFDNGKQYKLFTDGDRAWSEQHDRAIVQLLKKRNSLTVTGFSARGTKTIDRISLAGFSAAYKGLK